MCESKTGKFDLNEFPNTELSLEEKNREPRFLSRASFSFYESDWLLTAKEQYQMRIEPGPGYLNSEETHIIYQWKSFNRVPMHFSSDLNVLAQITTLYYTVAHPIQFTLAEFILKGKTVTEILAKKRDKEKYVDLCFYGETLLLPGENHIPVKMKVKPKGGQLYLHDLYVAFPVKEHERMMTGITNSIKLLG